MALRALSIKWKLILTVTVVCLAALIVAGVMLCTFEYITVLSMMESDLQTIAKISAENSTAALSFDDRAAAEDTLSALAAKPTIEAACLYTTKGEVFAVYSRTDNKLNLPERPKVDGFDPESRKLELFSPVTLKDKRIGTIYVRADLSQLNTWLKTYVLLSAAIVVITLVFAFLLASLLQRPLLAPILGLAETARRVSTEKDYSLRGAKQGDDELGVLIDQFNDMLATVQSRDKALEQARQELEQRVEVRTRDLREANKELEAFSYSVAHDLRAPLRSIDGFSHVLLEDYSASIDATGKDYLFRVRAATQRMAQLLDDMLKLSKVTRDSINPEPVDLSDMSKSILMELRRQTPSREVEFINTGSVVVSADPGLLRIVLENLLGNAWKFTGKQPKAAIELGQKQVDGKTAYFVRDNGAGFDMAFSARLFGVFHRLHTASDFPGTGVGLATVQRIINRHGGRIWAEAEVGKGATFFFTLN